MTDRATEAIRELVRITHPCGGGLARGPDAYALASGLAVMVDALPQILRQSITWLETQAMTGTLLVDGQASSGRAAALSAAADLDNARTAAVTLSRLLHDARKKLRTLSSNPDPTEN